MLAYTGGYTTPDRDGRGDGIHVFEVPPDNGGWREIQHISGLENPSLFTLRRDHSVLYTVHGGRTLISAFAIGKTTGRLTLLNQMDCGGTNPVDCALDPTERFLVIGNYGTGTVAVMPLTPGGHLLPVSQSVTLTGTPGPDPVHQTSSHPHAVIFDPTGRFVIVPDKGFDKTFVFRFEGGQLTPTEQGAIESKHGAAPRHTIFHPALPILFVNNELDSTVTVFAWDAGNGHLTEVQVLSTIPGGHQGRNTTAEIAVTPCGRFLYVSNRGQDSIVRFDIEQTTGRLTFQGFTSTGGSKPRFFTLDPAASRLFVANQDSDDITAFQIDTATGALRPLGVVARAGSPSAISFVPAP